MFGDTWQLVARTDQLVGPGDFVTVEVAGEPLLVLRDEVGELRAFFNVCRHRAACVLGERQGTVRRLRCRYHGWTYDLRRSAPRRAGVRRGRGVPSRGPRPRSGGGRPLGAADLRAPGRGASTAAAMARAAPDPPRRARGPPLLRAQGVRPRLQLEGLRRQLSGRRLPRELGAPGAGQRAPVLGVPDGVLRRDQPPVEPPSLGRPGHGCVRLGHPEGRPRPVRLGVPQRDGQPLRRGDGHQRGVPAGPGPVPGGDRLLLRAARRAEAQAFAARSVELGHRIQLEDVGICEDVQRGLGSRSYSTGRFSVRREVAVHHFHRLLAARLQSPG